MIYILKTIHLPVCLAYLLQKQATDLKNGVGKQCPYKNAGLSSEYEQPDNQLKVYWETLLLLDKNTVVSVWSNLPGTVLQISQQTDKCRKSFLHSGEFEVLFFIARWEKQNSQNAHINPPSTSRHFAYLRNQPLKRCLSPLPHTFSCTLPDSDLSPSIALPASAH